MTKNTVRKGIAFVITVIMMLPAVVWAQSEGFTLSGEVSFKKTGNIFIKLVTEEQFGDNEDEEDIPAEEQEGVAKLILKMSEQDLEQKKGRFYVRTYSTGNICYSRVSGREREWDVR